MSLLQEEIKRIDGWSGPRMSGRVIQVIGLLIESLGPNVSMGEMCYVYGKHKEPIPCQVVGFKGDKVLLMSFADVGDIALKSEVFPMEMPFVAVSSALRGRILDAWGRPIDGKGKIIAEKFYPISAPPPAPLTRKPIREPLITGIKAIDGLCTLGKGQRMGIFSSPGAGKSTLMGMIANNAETDINVIALIGERGREVRDLIDRELGSEGLARSVVIVATSDQAPLLRSLGAMVATAIAEFFRDLGQDVLLMMDSISRFAMAQKEVALAIGESAASRGGYPPSVFAHLSRLLERAGTSHTGSISGIYTVLCEEDEIHDPLVDQTRSLLDGHIHLSQELVAANHFPPIAILKSLSRIMTHITSAKQQVQAGTFRTLLHAYMRAEELIQMGAYVPGSSAKIDEALAKREWMQEFLVQAKDERVSFEKTATLLQKMENKK